jgi:hypothetical protein
MSKEFDFLISADASDYSITLNPSIQLNTNYKVAIAQAIMSQTRDIVDETSNWFKVKGPPPPPTKPQPTPGGDRARPTPPSLPQAPVVEIVHIPTGAYLNVQEIVQNMQMYMKPYFREHIHITVDYFNRVLIQTSPGFTIYFSNSGLAQLLGVDRKGKNIGECFMFQHTNFYIYTNCVRATILGDTKAHILGILSTANVGVYNNVLSFEPTHLDYIPCNTNIIHNLEIRIADTEGKLIKFKKPTLFFRLRFKPEEDG